MKKIMAAAGVTAAAVLALAACSSPAPASMPKCETAILRELDATTAQRMAGHHPSIAEVPSCQGLSTHQKLQAFQVIWDRYVTTIEAEAR